MKKKRTKFKAVMFGAAAIATSLLISMSAACKSRSSSSSDDEEDESGSSSTTTTTTAVDDYPIKNHNFEFYDDNGGKQPISTPNNWTYGTRGSSASTSGIINTRKDRWEYITDTSLPEELEEDKNRSKDDKINYKATTVDMPFENPHVATASEHKIAEEDYIANPFTHEYSYNEDGEVINSAGEVQKIYTDDDGNYFLDEEHETAFETSVLMIHNYSSTSNYMGNESYYSASSTISLEAGTSCKLSLWVKTSNLSYDSTQKGQKEVSFDRGAYIKLESSVSGNRVDDAFVIRNINTEQLNPENKNNGWVEYTIYVDSSNFSSTTLTLSVGLGEDGANTVEGYAFFDDITFERYITNTEMHKEDGYKNHIRLEDSGDKKANVCSPLEPKANFSFPVDINKSTTEDKNNSSQMETWTDRQFFDDRYFFINFASTSHTSMPLNHYDGATGKYTVNAGLAVEETSSGNYVCAKPDSENSYSPKNVGLLDNGAATAYLPTSLNGGIDVSDDILATFKITNEEAAEWVFPYNTFSEKLDKSLTDALKTAATLPDANNETTTLFIMSAYGATYEAEIVPQDGSFVLTGDEDSYVLISFWIKTSDMGGKTAATVTVCSIDDEDKTSSFTVDSTTVSPTEIGDDKNVYNDWARCFVRVSNTSGEEQQFKIKVNFGNTSINNTEKTAHNPGWLALTNLTVSELKKEVYGYTSNLSRSATLTFEDEETSQSHKFDEPKSTSRNEIETDIVIPKSYTGVNGASNSVSSSDDYTDYDKPNDNPYSGLINKDYVLNYTTCEWFNAIKTAANINDEDLADADKLWAKIAGDSNAVQPLVIVNSARKFNDETKIYNYGYYGNNTTISANSYSSVSVRVKVSSGAIATVYLVDDTNEHNVKTYSTPTYTFWYDEAGNVLKDKPEEDWSATKQKANIAYKLRTDGLYECNDTLYANMYNLSTYIDINYYEAEDEGDRSKFYDKDKGAYLSVEDAIDLVNGRSFMEAIIGGDYLFADNSADKYCDHYLVAGGEQNNKIYKYCSGLGADATYYYMEDGKPNTSKVVHLFNINPKDEDADTYATLRYDRIDNEPIPYQFTIDTVEHPEYADKWVTVTFNIHAGNKGQTYRLELWSGYRDEQSSYSAEQGNSYVMFDYSSISLDQSTYTNWLKEYTDKISSEYRKTIIANGDTLEDNDANLAELEELAGGKSSTLFGGNYYYDYFTFSLYDSAAFIPFNGEIQTDKAGYSYNYSDYSEALALFAVEDMLDADGKTKDAMQMVAFVDYSVIDKEVEIIPLHDSDEEEKTTEDEETETKPKSSTNVGLLAASIALVVAIFIALIALFLKSYLGKHRRKGKSAKNSYNFKKNKRYVKKYVKANGEAPEINEEDVDKSLLVDAEEPEQVAEQTPEVEESVEQAEPETADEPAVQDAEETAEVSEEQPSSEEEPSTPSEEEKPDDGESN